MYNPNIYYPGYTSFPGYVGGGRVAQQQKHGLAAAAEQLRKRGRGGDTILAHINPQEAGILKLLGGSGTINPQTGLPEFGFFKELKKAVSNPIDYVKRNVTAEKMAAPVAATVAFIASGGNPAAAAAASAAVGAAQGRSAEDVAKSALLTYAGASLGAPGDAGSAGSAAGGGAAELASVGATGYGLTAPVSGATGAATGSIVDPGIIPAPTTAATAPTTITPIPPSGPSNVFEYGYPSSGTAAGGAGAGLSGYDLSYSIPGASPATSAAAPISEAVGVAGAGAGAATPSTASGISSLGGAALDTITGGIKALAPSSVKEAIQLASTGALGYGTVMAAQETKKQREAAEREIARQEALRQENIRKAESIMAETPTRYRRLTAEDVRRYGIGMPQQLMPPIARAAKGGSINDMTFDDELGYDYARGGITALPPRYLSGGGDGMSDSIPARIGGKQEARLSDSEFVIPADIVSHLGNGSSNAGAKKLYAMMDRIRKARTGKTKQAPAINARRLMPA